MSERDSQFRSLYRELRLADQQRYYTDRSIEYEQADRQAIIARNVFLIVAAFVGVGGQFTTGSGRAACGVAAALLAALAGAVTAFNALIGYPVLRKLYSDAALNLAEAQIDWDAAGAADQRQEMERVEKIMRAENGQWGQLVIKSAPERDRTTADGG